MGWFDRLLGRDFSKLKEQGDRHFDDGQYGMALRDFEAALRFAAPGDAQAVASVEAQVLECRARLAVERRARADELKELGHLEEAEEHYRDALQLIDDPEDRELVFTALREIEAAEQEVAAGVVGPEEDEEDEAEEQTSDLFELHLLRVEDEERVEAYRALGDAFARAYVALQEGDAALCLELLEGSFSEDPSLLVRRELGRALLYLGRTDEALANLKAYVDSAPEDLEALWSLADAHIALDSPAQAEVLLSAALEASPESTSTRLRLAELLIAMEKGEAAIECLELGLESEPRSIPLHRNMGYACLVSQDEDGAREAWEQALALRWHLDHDTGVLDFDTESAWSLAQLLLRRGEEPERALDLIRALSFHVSGPERPGLLRAQAAAHRAMGQLEEAQKTLITARSLVDDEQVELREALDEALASVGEEMAAS